MPNQRRQISLYPRCVCVKPSRIGAAVLPVSILCRLLLLRLSSLRSLDSRNCLGLSCRMLFPDRSSFTMSDGRSPGTLFNASKRERRRNRTWLPVGLCKVGAYDTTQHKVECSRIMWGSRSSPSILIGFQDVVWVVCNFVWQHNNTSLLCHDVGVFPLPSVCHAHFLSVSFKAVMHKTVIPTYSQVGNRSHLVFCPKL